MASPHRLPAAALAAALGLAQVAAAADAERPAEAEVALPAAPQAANLVEVYVSAASANHFYVDAATLAVGADGIVRYALVVKTAGGATNATYEGIRCASGEYRIYATGHGDGSWARARGELWRPIENKPVNRQHAALAREFFCPDGIAVGSSDAARSNLRRGGAARSTY
jgi:hypothetical protein